MGPEREAPAEDARLGLIYGGQGPRASRGSGACWRLLPAAGCPAGPAAGWALTTPLLSTCDTFTGTVGQVIYGYLLPRRHGPCIWSGGETVQMAGEEAALAPLARVGGQAEPIGAGGRSWTDSLSAIFQNTVLLGMNLGTPRA